MTFSSRTFLEKLWSVAWFVFIHIPRPVWRVARWLAVLAVVALASVVLALRWYVLPKVEHYQPQIEAQLARSLKLPIRIEAVSAEWGGLRPILTIRGVQLLDHAARTALRLDRVEAEVGWISLITASLRLNRLEVFAPALSVRREADGHIYVAGIKLDTQSSGSDVSDWVLSQSSIIIRGASIDWVDAKRGAPPLVLRDVNFRLDNSGSRHRFGLRAKPPEALATRLDLRGDLKGRHLADLADWHGEIYTELEYADLAGWRAWVDYPVWLPHGSGSLRLWAGFAERKVTSVTADLALRGVTLKLAQALPAIDLEHLSGRLRVRLPTAPEGRHEISVKRLVLSLRDGVSIPPLDFETRWVPVTDRAPGRGAFSASNVELASLAMLSRYVPLEPRLRDALERYAPTGRMSDMRLEWSMDDTGLKTWDIEAEFASLGLAPVGVAPGFEGMSGSIDANHRGGSVVLDAHGAALSLPAVFPEQRLALDQLAARLNWSVTDGLIDAQLQNLTLANEHAAGQVSGRWRGRAGQSGEIDLVAQLARARPDAVWRYLPHKVGQQARDWVQAALKGGACQDTRLKLKGPLAKFPFEAAADGHFSVTSQCQGVTLDYAAGWPQAEQMSAKVLFEGKRMEVRATSGTILGAQIGPVTAQIPDLLHHDEILLLDGKARGPSAEFVKFMNQSPLSRKLGEFTGGLDASGNGALALKLNLPLRRLSETRVEGDYQFKGNRIQFAEGFPAVTDAAATVQFSERALAIRGGSGQIFGAPFTLAGQTRDDGSFTASAQGRLVAAEMRRTTELGFFDQLSGNTPWQASLTVKSGAVSLMAESSLQGLASSLPAPFNKTAADTLPLKLEVGGKTLRLTLARALNLQLQRGAEPGARGFERGVIAINDNAALPERGVLLAANLKSFDANAWRRAFMPAGQGGGAASLPVSAIALKAGVATVGGQVLNDLQLQGSLTDSTWQMRLASREASGEISYRTSGKGRVIARLKHLAMGDLKAEDSGNTPAATAAEQPTELPGLDVTVDNFSLKGHALGKLELQAANRGPIWRMEKLAITNPDGSVTGEGQWRTLSQPKSTEPATQVNLKVDSGNIGRLLDRLGYGEAMRRGNGRLEAKLSWAGPPTNIDYPSLNGEIKLDASNGQFSKLEPGVGRLLGVVSLQSLPRRITLDFRDVFSEGFAFDSISGSMQVKNGVMTSDELRIRGPAARVSMKGDVDLAAETQNLRVKVQPTLSESVAIGAAIANPVAGVATYLAQKVLRDPFEKIFAFEYAVTGTWADPKVVKLGNEEKP